MLRRTTSMVLATGVLVIAGCSGDQRALTTSSSTAGLSEPAGESYPLAAPTIGRPPEDRTSPFATIATATDCNQVNEVTEGILAPATRAQLGDQVVCWVVTVPGEATVSAGVLFAPNGTVLETESLLEILDAGGLLVAATVGALDVPAILSESRYDAPGGGYAAFDVDADTRGEVHRPAENRSSVRFVRSTESGLLIEISLGANRTPDDLVRITRETFGRG